MSQQLVTLNVSVTQIEEDLRRGRTVAEIAQDWSEPPANVYAVQRAMQARNGAAERPSPLAVPPRPVPPQPRPVPAVPDDEQASALDLVEQASKSKSARTRSLGAKLDKLVEEIAQRLDVERREHAEIERKRQEQAAARAEIERLEAALREAKAKLAGDSKKRASSTKTADNPSSGAKSARPAYPGGPTSSEIREWAKSNGVDCHPHGQIPNAVITAYRTAVGDA